MPGLGCELAVPGSPLGPLAPYLRKTLDTVAANNESAAMRAAERISDKRLIATQRRPWMLARCATPGQQSALLTINNLPAHGCQPSQ
jgi:hypothetical protein